MKFNGCQAFIAYSFTLTKLFHGNCIKFELFSEVITSSWIVTFQLKQLIATILNADSFKNSQFSFTKPISLKFEWYKCSQQYHCSVSSTLHAESNYFLHQEVMRSPKWCLQLPPPSPSTTCGRAQRTRSRFPH